MDEAAINLIDEASDIVAEYYDFRRRVGLAREPKTNWLLGISLELEGLADEQRRARISRDGVEGARQAGARAHAA